MAWQVDRPKWTTRGGEERFLRGSPEELRSDLVRLQEQHDHVLRVFDYRV